METSTATFRRVEYLPKNHKQNFSTIKTQSFLEHKTLDLPHENNSLFLHLFIKALNVLNTLSLSGKFFQLQQNCNMNHQEALLHHLSQPQLSEWSVTSFKCTLLPQLHTFPAKFSVLLKWNTCSLHYFQHLYFPGFWICFFLHESWLYLLFHSCFWRFGLFKKINYKNEGLDVTKNCVLTCSCWIIWS